jgi:hypothetical protein
MPASLHIRYPRIPPAQSYSGNRRIDHLYVLISTLNALGDTADNVESLYKYPLEGFSDLDREESIALCKEIVDGANYFSDRIVETPRNVLENESCKYHVRNLLIPLKFRTI